MARLREELARQGTSVAFTNGCFDLLHLGHTQLIRHAREQADVLIVGINTDRSVQELKGPDRPINDEDVRARMLAALEDVDYVVMFDEKSVLPLIRQLRPDVLVKGGDYDKSGVVGADFVESYGGRIELAPEVEGFSTTDIIDRIAGNHD
jgi:D-beta-D-heptose 7-phosphate kinase/D-beta-D-heptose 1-phosphate adenosyltransferase